jgi:hypothetical protein
MNTVFYSENLDGDHHLGNTGIDGRAVLKCVLFEVGNEFVNVV